MLVHGHHNRQRPSTLGVVLGNAADCGRILSFSGRGCVPVLAVLAVVVAFFLRLSVLAPVADVSFRISCLCNSFEGQSVATMIEEISDSLESMPPLSGFSRDGPSKSR